VECIREGGTGAFFALAKTFLLETVKKEISQSKLLTRPRPLQGSARFFVLIADTICEMASV